MENSFSRFAPPALLEALKDSTPDTPDVRSQTSSVDGARDNAALSKSVFDSMLTFERQRAERSRVPFVLMLLDAHRENGSAAGYLRQAAEVVLATKRETDLVGWYREGAILGVIFTEVTLGAERPVTETLRAKVETALVKRLGAAKAATIFFSFHVFPETQE